jgi:hypothetical protein
VIRLLETLAVELERPRILTAQVINHLVGTYGLTRDGVGEFLTTKLSGLEDYEIDLILSPLFTPGLKEQAVFAELLGRDPVSSREWPGLVDRLVARPTLAALVLEDGRTERSALRAVTVERFVHRLRLDGSIADPMFQLITRLAPPADQPLLKAIARRAAWTAAGRGEILFRYLTATLAGEGFRVEDAADLLKLVETYEPAGVAELRASIPHWREVLRQEIAEAGGARPFFNERVQDLHGGGRDQRRQDHARIAAKEAESALLERLDRALAG